MNEKQRDMFSQFSMYILILLFGFVCGKYYGTNEIIFMGTIVILLIVAHSYWDANLYSQKSTKRRVK